MAADESTGSISSLAGFSTSELGAGADSESLNLLALRLIIYDGEAEAHRCDLPLVGEFEVGRQRPEDSEPYGVVGQGDDVRVTIAALDQRAVSRRHATIRVTELGVAVTNTSSSAQVAVKGGDLLGPGESGNCQLPVEMILGTQRIRVERVSNLESLTNSLLTPRSSQAPPTRFEDVLAVGREERDAGKVVEWLKSTMDVFHSAASDPDFYRRAAEATASIASLDIAAILLAEKEGWRVETTHVVDATIDPEQWRPSQRMLDEVRRERTTLRFQPDGSSLGGAQPTQMDVVAIVAAPILDVDGAVRGVLYGEKRSIFAGKQANITELTAMLVELLASGVAAGVARLEQEQAALAARVKFEQFFTPELSQRLETDPSLLEGRARNVSVLFCDIRSFSRIAERIGAEQTLSWIYETMSALSECVMEQKGVLVGYQGDQVMAMWGAPFEQPDHATLACRAAIAMLKRLPATSEAWRERVGEETRVGIGINSGIAHVGNIGSRQKFTYGPLGNAVNLASRIQGATRHLGVDLLVGEETAGSLDPKIERRRLCQVRVANIKEPVTLYEATESPADEWLDLKERYERALEFSEAGDLHAAARELGQTAEAHPKDQPTLLLMARVVDAMRTPDTPIDPVWELSGK